MSTKIKICGLKDIAIAINVCNLGADALGFVFFKKSVRYIDFKQAKEIISELPCFVQTVGVFVNPSFEEVKSALDCGIDILQFHGDESINFCKEFYPKVIKAVRIKDESDIVHFKKYEGVCRAFLIDTYTKDTYGGTGKVANWNLAKKAIEAFEKPVILAGGLTPDNVKEAILKLHPYGVDVSSGVESSLGKKDISLIERFINAVREIE